VTAIAVTGSTTEAAAKVIATKTITAATVTMTAAAANLARQKKLSVYVAEECNSVCAFVFFAAAKRYLAQNSRIGVHSISNSRYIEDLSSMRLTLRLARLSAKLGAPQSAIGKFVTTRPSNITYLDGGDLSALDTSVGNPFHYQRPEKSSGAADEQQQGCSG